ncbi:hypothetical protein [Peribacillus sp. SCS-155]|uniref:hypothetical protein n=1 Tax=Peribacillus sedimenti TaxID=3115297 RepID=UPI0039063B79
MCRLTPSSPTNQESDGAKVSSEVGLTLQRHHLQSAKVKQEDRKMKKIAKRRN